VYIADGYGQHWVHRYSPEGRYMDSFGGPGEDLGKMNNPHGVSVDTRSGEELILVSDRKNVRLQYFTLEGKPLRCVTENLRFPCTAEVWGNEVYIPDLYSRVTILDKDDNLIVHLGDRPRCWEQEGWPDLPPSEWVVGGFSSPHDLHVDKAGNIYVAEWMKNGTGKVTKLIRVP
jgi:hypothetical protein